MALDLTWFRSNPATVNDISKHFALCCEGVFHDDLLRCHRVLHFCDRIEQQRISTPNVSSAISRISAGAVSFAGAADVTR